MAAYKFEKGSERFNKISLLKEKYIGNEKVKLEIGERICLYTRHINVHNKNFDMYAVWYSRDAGVYNNVDRCFFTIKEEALEFYKSECKRTKAREKHKATSEPKENLTVTEYVEEREKNLKAGKAVSLDIGLEEIAKAYGGQSESLLEELSHSNNPLVCRAVANNSFTNTSTLDWLWKNTGGDYEIELMILNNPHTDINILEKTINDNLHIDKVAIAKANIIRRDIFLDYSITFSYK